MAYTIGSLTAYGREDGRTHMITVMRTDNTYYIDVDGDLKHTCDSVEETKRTLRLLLSLNNWTTINPNY